jgi:hypothetical protein
VTLLLGALIAFGLGHMIGFHRGYSRTLDARARKRIREFGE